MCFGHSEFGTLLEPLWPLGEDAGIEITKGGNLPDFKTAEELEKDEDNAAPHTNRRSSHVESSARTARRKMVNSIKPGDTISTPPDGAGTGTKWRKELAKGTTDDHRWFGVVQRVHESPGNHARSFDVIWLYRPVDTPCGKMVYPWSKELFLSDHCTCEEGRDARVDEDEVLDCHNVDWFGAPETSTAEFFVRQTYQVEQRRWVALERDHMTCNHDKSRRLEYTRGDTVLACAGNDERTDVYEVVKVFRQGRNRFVRLQRLIRRSELQPHKPSVPPNELVYTEQVVVMKLQRILSKCIVRFFEVGEPIPCPYDRNGTANVFFVTHRLENGLCVPIPSHNRPTTMRQGFDPKKRVEKLRGLDLFCGSGNFGRGLEEGGVVDMRWTNDIWTEAIHTYMANASHHTKPFLGSVDDLLRCAIEGNAARGVPRRGEVDIISGGSPCQGFSLITNDKGNDRQKKNRSLVASFASFVDFYRPKYGVLENVVSIVQTGRGREEDAFSQLVCAIVGMGYQAQLTLGDAWSYGAPQSRSRVFLYFAAADQRLPEPPRSSHSHFDGVKSRGLGRMSNGEAFVSRSFGPTPFKFVSAAEATADIPDIQDAKPEYCVGYPDHRISLGVTSKSRHQYHQIPIQPYGMNFLKAWNNGHGTMTAAERELFPETGFRVQKLSQGWGRVKPNSVFHTITTCVTPTDARTGRFLHWHQDRPVTILEARRAQGFLDHEVLVGTPASQYELVGNSVARPMALALGLQFREALMGSLYDDRASGSLSADETHTVTGVSPMANVKVEGREEQKEEVGLIQRGLADDDDDDSLFVRDSPDLEGQRWDDVRRVDTPPTSLSGSEIKEGPPTVSRKRPLSSLALELEVSNVHNVEVELVHERHGDTEPRPRSPQTRLDGGTTGHLSAASAVEHEHDHVDADSGEVSPERGNWSRLLNEDSLRKGPST
jgi:DNA (cytosine-5)-methyltransferase 1